MFWLVLSVVFSNSFVALLHAQGSGSYGCNSSWVLYPNTGIYGGTEQPSVATEDDCKTSCNQNVQCVGIDYNPSNDVGHRCYLQNSTGPKMTFNGVNHWDYNRTAPCTGSCGSWTPFPNTGQYGGIEQPGITSESDCKTACQNGNGSCTGIDWNGGNPVGHQCYFQYGSGTMYSANGVTHWEYNSTAGCMSPCGTWTSISNTGVYGGTLRPDVTSQDWCKMACSQNITCTGYDWNDYNAAGQQCYLQFGYGTKYSANGVTHWDFNRTGPCPVDCMSVFTASPNTGAYGGVEQPNIINFTDCKRACIQNTSCVGCDWNSNNAQGHQCYLLFTYGAKYSGNGVTHYDFNRSACNGSSGGPIGAATSTTQTPLSSPSGGACANAGCYWQEIDNANIFGGTVDSSNTFSDCQCKCLATSGCQSVDFVQSNSNGQRCYLLQTQSGRAPANWGVNHYDYVCPDTRCWSVMANTNAYGGSLVQSAATVAQCQNACLSQSYKSFDFDRNQNACYIFSSPVSSTNQSPGVDHYTYIC